MTRILIAQPTTGTVLNGTVEYMMQLVRAFDQRKIQWDYKSLALSDIALSRNILASHLIAGNDFTHLLFLDSDMGFLSETVLKLLEFGEPLTAAAYPKRYLGWEALRQASETEAKRGAARRATPDLIDAISEYTVDTKRFDGSDWTAERRGDFLSVPACGTGIMLIHRDVFEIMLAREVAIPRPGYTGLPLLGDAPLCDFFSPIEVPDRSLIESEDISFCKRWVEDCGGKVWLDINSRTMHFGVRGHAGRYAARAAADFPNISEG